MSSGKNTKEITIIGAGLVGSLLSILLAKEGFQVKVYEKRPNPLTTEAESGRSINLALSYRGIKTLEMAGVAEKVMKLTIPMEGRMLHEPNGQTILQPYGEAGQQINSVSRSGLTALLIEEAIEKYGVSFFFNMSCEGIDPENKFVRFTNSESGDRIKESFDLIIGADGAFSAVRSSMQKFIDMDFSLETLEHSYKELHIHPGPNFSHQLYKNALHIWPRKQFMLIALPNLDGSFTVTLFLATEGDISFQFLKDKDTVEAFFSDYFPDALPLIPDLAEQFSKNPTSFLGTIRCSPWIYQDKVMLIGDAAHAIVPFYGQGMNAGFEDCRILIELIRENQNLDWKIILNKFQEERKENADAIAELALRNFHEMRDDVADEKFLLRKKIEAEIHKRFPHYLPLYTMVTFSDLSYKEALEKGNKQKAFMDEIMETKHIAGIWESEEFWVRMEKKLKVRGFI